ncbi:MAG: hypothetical protein QXE80_09325 [Pyrobaculum sp.]
MSPLLDLVGLTALMVISVASVMWYFRERKKILKLMRDFVVELEEVFKPVDKTYTLLGYLVGFRAVYKLHNGDQLYVLFTTAPRYAFLYLPFVKLLGREDLATYFYKTEKPKRLRTYIAVREKSRRISTIVESDIKRLGLTLQQTTVETPAGRYVVYYELGGSPYLINEVVNKFNVDIRKLAVYGSLNAVEITTPSLLGHVEKIWDLIKKMYKTTTIS